MMASCYHHGKSKHMMVFSQLRGWDTYSKGRSPRERITAQFCKGFTSAYPGGEVQIVLWGTALIPTFPKEQDLVWVSAGGTAGLGITASTVRAACWADRKENDQVITIANTEARMKQRQMLQRSKALSNLCFNYGSEASPVISRNRKCFPNFLK